MQKTAQSWFTGGEGQQPGLAIHTAAQSGREERQRRRGYGARLGEEAAATGKQSGGRINQHALQRAKN